MRTRFHLLALLVVVAPTVSVAQRTDADAVNLVDRVYRHYQDAESIHLEATRVTRVHEDMMDQTSTQVLAAYEASGGRFRYEGKTAEGHGIVVSNGTEEWRYLPSFQHYTRKPAGTYHSSAISQQGDDRGPWSAYQLIGEFNYISARVDKTHFDADERVTYAGRSVLCAVVETGPKEGTLSSSLGSSKTSSETKLWIDEATLTILKMEQRSSSALWYGMKPSPYGPVRETLTTTSYTTVALNFEPAEATFAFIPPKGAEEVANLPSPFAPTDVADTKAREPLPSEKIAAGELGKQLPDISLVDAAGNSFSLSRYAGHPLLIDVWAAWCVPCVSELPALNNIRKSTAQTDLKIIAIDEDTKPGTSLDLLHRRGYDWEDFHYNHALTKALPTTGIPLTVLVDSTGEIVFYQIGGNDLKGLAAAIAKLGKPYEAASAEK